MNESFDDVREPDRFDDVKSDNNESLASLGDRLREERNRQGFTLDYVADETKIRKSYLESIELGEMDVFNGNVYRRGFVKKYLGFLGRMDLWKSYDSILVENVSDKKPDPQPALGDFTPPARGFRKGSRKGVFLLLMAVIISAGWYVWSNREGLHDEVVRIQEEKVAEQEKREEEAKLLAARQREIAAASADLASSDISEVALAGASVDSAVSSSPASVESESPILAIKALKDSWIRITREGERVFGGTLKAGATSEVEATGLIHVIYGRPETLSVSWNGKRVDPSTEGAGPVHFVYSSDGTQKAITSDEAEALWKEPSQPVSAEKVDKEEKPAPGPKKLLIRASKGDCWIKATRDGKTVYVGTLKKGDQREMDLTSSIKVTFGNPTAVAVSLDGKDAGRPGTPGRVGRIVYETDGSVRDVSEQ